MSYGAVSLIPIILCFSLIFISKNAFVAIISGIVAAVAIILVGEGNFVLLQSVADVYSSASTVYSVLFVLIVGALIKATDLSKGVSGLMVYLERKKLNITSPILVQLFTMCIGMLLFVDATSSMAITSVVGKPLFQKANISTEKLALITNSTASPIAWLVPFGGAGALMTGLISAVDGIEQDAFGYVLQAVPLQFYTIVLLVFLVITVVGGFDLGSLKHYEASNPEGAQGKAQATISKADTTQAEGKARNMIVPIVLLLVCIFTILAITGGGNIFKGNGSAAVFYGGLITLGVTLVFYLAQKTATLGECLGWYLAGVKSMFVVTLLLAVALVFSDLLAKVGTAAYLVGVFDVLPANFLPLIALLLSAVIAFSTGTSGGTVAIVTGLLLPMAVMSNVSIPLVLGAIVSGAVFGDQNSVISDSVIVTSSVTGVDAITHVKTQMPYTIIALGVSAVLYFILGFLM